MAWRPNHQTLRQCKLLRAWAGWTLQYDRRWSVMSSLSYARLTIFTHDISETIRNDVSKPIILESEYEIPKLYEEYDQYLYFENTRGVKYFFPVTGPIPSHYLRTLIANAIGQPERADWEKYFSRDAINNFKKEIMKGVNDERGNIL